MLIPPSLLQEANLFEGWFDRPETKDEGEMYPNESTDKTHESTYC